MMAVKASYDNGVMHWFQKPPGGGHYLLTVVFEDVEQPQTDAEKKQEQKLRAMDRLESLCDGVPPSVSLVDMLLEERRREAANG